MSDASPKRELEPIRRKRTVDRLMPWLAILLTAVIWEWLVWQTRIHPSILPAPSRIVQVAWNERQVLSRAVIVTSAGTWAGLACSIAIGTLLGVLFSQFRLVRRAFYPYVVFFQTVPVVAIAPLLILWSGYNFRTIVLISVIISLFPIVSNVTTGLLSIDKNLRDLFAIYRSTRWQYLRYLAIPSAIGHLLLGARISCGLALIGTILGEMLVGNAGAYDGLGSIMQNWRTLGRTAGLMAAIAISTGLGILFLGLINLIGKTLLKRWTSATGFEMVE